MSPAMDDACICRAVLGPDNLLSGQQEGTDQFMMDLKAIIDAERKRYCVASGGGVSLPVAGNWSEAARLAREKGWLQGASPAVRLRDGA